MARLPVKYKLAIFVIAALLVVLLSILQLQMKSAGDGQLVLFAPPDQPLHATVDGRELSVPVGGARRVRVKHGAHQVVVTGGPTRRVEVESGRDVLGVPAFDPQCFDELDVTLSHYGDSAGKVAPTVTRHFRFDHPFQLGSMAVATDELPKSASERVKNGKIVGMQLVHLLVSAPCREGDTYSPGL